MINFKLCQCVQTNVHYWTEIITWSRIIIMFWPVDPAKNAIQGDAPEGSDTF